MCVCVGLRVDQEMVTSYPQVAVVRVPTPWVQSDSDITVLRHLEKMGCRLVNRPQAILNCVNKFWTFQELAGHGVPLPDTFSYGQSIYQSIDQSINPFILPSPVLPSLSLSFFPFSFLLRFLSFFFFLSLHFFPPLPQLHINQGRLTWPAEICKGRETSGLQQEQKGSDNADQLQLPLHISL